MLVLIGGAVSVWANPGDAVAVPGILAWPALRANEPFLVVRADKGRFYYTDVTAAERRGTAALRAGNRVAVVGTEGARPHELTATALGPDADAVWSEPPDTSAPSLVSGEAAAAPRTDSTAPPPPGRPGEP